MTDRVNSDYANSASSTSPTSPTNALIDVRDLSIGISGPNGTQSIVRQFNLQVARGETVGIVGESGSGKTMAMLAITRLLPGQATIDSRQMTLGDVDLTDLAALTDQAYYQQISGKRIAMIFQEPMSALNPVVTIGRQLTEAMLMHGDGYVHGHSTAKQARDRAIEMLVAVQMPDPEARLAQYPHQLSGGQRQRIMIAMALMMAPELLIADEPTTALDVTVQNDIINLLISLQKKLGLAMIFISHDLAVVSRVSQRIVVMRHGDIIETGPTQAVLSKPTQQYTRDLLACLWKLDTPKKSPEVIETETQTEIQTKTQAETQIESPIESQPETPIIQVKQLKKSFKLRRGLLRKAQTINAVDNLSFEVKQGEKLAIVGESGSGKSTLARIINGLNRPDSGTVLFDEKPIDSYSGLDRARLVQPVFQDPYATLNPKQTIGNIVSRPLTIHMPMSPSQTRDKVQQTLDEVGLPTSVYHRYPSQLSGGQRQRVAIARAIVLTPRVLICDEPTSALDVSIQDQILNLLTDLHTRLDLTLLLISHDMAVVKFLSDRVLVMKDGAIVEEGATQDVLNHPQASYTQKLMDSVYVLPRQEATAC